MTITAADILSTEMDDSYDPFTAAGTMFPRRPRPHRISAVPIPDRCSHEWPAVWNRRGCGDCDAMILIDIPRSSGWWWTMRNLPAVTRRWRRAARMRGSPRAASAMFRPRCALIGSFDATEAGTGAGGLMRDDPRLDGDLGGGDTPFLGRRGDQHGAGGGAGLAHLHEAVGCTEVSLIAHAAAEHADTLDTLDAWTAPSANLRMARTRPGGCDTARAMAMVTRYVMFYQA
ncbi:hypothetical protein [Paracoccus mutanolyticus]|uniref:hypothetical protein n=1 Tax=Paracoccus mutanolyticus TaxID=1499308 RepID=UPI001674A0E5|nr:hypothetical protein [Paracoccus mutanolyticus]